MTIKPQDLVEAVENMTAAELKELIELIDIRLGLKKKEEKPVAQDN